MTGGCTPGEPPSCVPQGRGGCTPGKPLSCLRQGRVRGRTGRAGPWPGWTGRLLAYGKGGSFVPAARWEHANVHGKPTLSARLTARRSCLFLRLVAGEASPAPPGRGLCPLLTLLRGALPPGPPKGVRDRTGRAAFLPTARARVPFLHLGENTRTRAHDSHARASASGPKREEKFFAKLSFKKAGEAGEIGRGIGSGL